MAKFISKFNNHILVMAPTRRVIEDGMSYLKQGKSINFNGHTYETADTKEISFLRSHRLYGTDIIEEKTKEEKAKETK